MTICVSTLFRWNYGTKENPELGLAAVAASDRMITAFDIEYEPTQSKHAVITPRVFVLIAGDYPIHSEAIQSTLKELRGNANAHPRDVALAYGRAIQAIKQRHAEDLILAPMGMNTDTFLGQQKDLADAFVEGIKEQLQKFQGGDVEALVVGSDGQDAFLYQIDTRGTAHLLNDVGFGAIGMGAWHAKSRLMQHGYVNTVGFAPALAAAFAAKKNAEIAPGVGRATDMRLLTRFGIEVIRTDIFEKLSGLYDKYETDRLELARHAVDDLQNFINTGGKKADQNDKDRTEGSDTSAQTNAGANPSAAENARKDEDGPVKTISHG